MFSIIVAIGNNNEIGKNNKLLWHIPEDLKKFKEITQGKTVIMGRNTYESIGKPLPDRHNIVLSKDLKLFSNNYNEKLEICDNFSEIVKKYENSDEEIFIIGGAQVYKKALESGIVEKLYISHIDFSDDQADTYFSEIDYNMWKKIEEDEYAGWKFCVYKKMK
jgi:dihydrofolate reductase